MVHLPKTRVIETLCNAKINEYSRPNESVHLELHKHAFAESIYCSCTISFSGLEKTEGAKTRYIGEGSEVDAPVRMD